MTLTGSTPEELTAISTDPDPDPDFYDLSVADAVANGRPTVIVFATPAFCQTAVCGPTIEIAKQAAEGRDGVDFVHVEPFDVELARANDLQPIPAMFEWGLATEPWIFVIDAEGSGHRPVRGHRRPGGAGVGDRRALTRQASTRNPHPPPRTRPRCPQGR